MYWNKQTQKDLLLNDLNKKKDAVYVSANTMVYHFSVCKRKQFAHYTKKLSKYMYVWKLSNKINLILIAEDSYQTQKLLIKTFQQQNKSSAFNHFTAIKN